MNRHAKAPSAFTFGRKVALALVLTAMSLFALAPAAFAKSIDRFYGFTSGAQGGQLNVPRDVAVNEAGTGGAASGDIYVVESGSHRVSVLSVSGAFKFAFGRDVVNNGVGATGFEKCTVAADCKQGITGTLGGEFNSLQGIAINQATGDLFVRDRNNNRVQQFSATGTFIRAWGWDVVDGANNPGATGDDTTAPVNELEICSVASQCKIGVSGTGAGQFGTSSINGTGIAVAPAGTPNAGHVFVVDPNATAGARGIEEFDPALAPANLYVRSFGTGGTGAGQFNTNMPQHVAVDSAGIVYGSDTSGNGRINRYTDTGVSLNPIAVPPLLNGGTGTASTSGLEIDPDSDGIGADVDRLYVLRDPTAGNTVIQQFDESGAVTVPTESAQHATSEFGTSLMNGLGINVATDRLYASGQLGNACGSACNGVYVLDNDGTSATAEASLQGTTNTTASTATVNGTLATPDGLIHYHFEYSKDGNTWIALPVQGISVTGFQPVSATLSELEANTLYRLRLVVRKVRGTSLATTMTTPESVFTTDAVAPNAETLPPFKRATSSAGLSARINPNGSLTTYRFEWGKSTAYGNQVPVPAGNAGSAGSPTYVTEQIAGLEPDTAYHYRVVAQSAQGTATGADVTFTTRTNVSSGPERVYEMVTPPFKVIRAAVAPIARPRNNPNVAIPSLDGEAMAWTTPFFALGDDVGAPALGDHRILRRTSQGWINETMNTLRFINSNPSLLRQRVTGSAGDLRSVGWANGGGDTTAGALLPYEGFSQNRVYTRRTGTGTEGFTSFMPNPDLQRVRFSLNDGGITASSDVAAFDDDGTAMARSGFYRALAEDLGTATDDDPSDEQQFEGPAAGGTTVYLQRDPNPDAVPTAPKELVGECSGSGPDATLIPARVGSGLATDTIGTQSCSKSTGTPAATGSGTLTDNSTSVTSVTIGTGAFSVGQIVSGVGIKPATRIVSVGAETLTLSASVTTGAKGLAKRTAGSPVLTEVTSIGMGEFAVGQTITGTGIPGGTTIAAVGDSTLTLSANATSTTGNFRPEIVAAGPPSLPGVVLTATPQHVTSLRGARLGGSSMGLSGAVGINFTLDSTQATAMSDDGFRTFFQSPDHQAAGAPTGSPSSCSTATASATDCVPQLYVRQYKSNGEAIVRWISRAQGIGAQQIGMLGMGANFQGASRDGRYVYFKTNAPLLPSDPNGGTSITTGSASNNSWDLYRYELPADLDEDPANGTLTRISGGPSGTADPATNAPDGMDSPLRFHSDDGKRAYFLTTSPIAGTDATPPAGGATTPGGTPAGGTRNLYLFDDNESGANRYKFIAQVGGACASRGGTIAPQILYATNVRGEGDVVEGTSCFYGTADGRYVTFFTRSALTTDDRDGFGDIYLYDAAEDELIRVTKPLPGSAPYRCQGTIGTPPAEADGCYGDFSTAASWGAGGISAAGDYEAARGWGGMRYSNIAVDDNGAVSVFFESQSRLVPEDTNGDYFDVYEWRNGELSLVSPGNTNDDAWFSGNSKDGEDVFFFTSQRIDPREIDPADFDIYDARQGGGIPYTPPPTPCDVLSFQCEVEANAAPPARGAATSSFSGQGNAPASKPKPTSKRCTKGKVRRKGKCVKRAKRAASKSGRAGR